MKIILRIFAVLLPVINFFAPAILAQETRELDVVGQIGGNTKVVFVEGNKAYIGVGPSLVILDISNPAIPKKLGQMTLAGSTTVNRGVQNTSKEVCVYRCFTVTPTK